MTTKEAVNILNLNDDFTIEQLKSSYRKLLKENHPDKHTHTFIDMVSANEKTAKIVEAYKILIQEQKNATIQAQDTKYESYDTNYQHKANKSNQSNFKSKKTKEEKKDLYQDFIGKYQIPMDGKNQLEMNWAFSFILKALFYPILVIGNIYGKTIGKIESQIIRKLSLTLFVVAIVKVVYELGMVIFQTIFSCYLLLAFSLQGLMIFRVILEGIASLFKSNIKISPNGGMKGSLMYLSLYYLLLFVSGWILSNFLNLNKTFPILSWDEDKVFLNAITLYYIVLLIIVVLETSAFVRIRKYIRKTTTHLYEIEKLGTL